MKILESINKRFPDEYDATKYRYRCLLVMLDLGVLSITGTPARRLVDKDPIEELRVVKTSQEANAMLARGWRVLGTSSSEPWEAMLARPRSVAPDEQDATPSGGCGVELQTKGNNK